MSDVLPVLERAIQLQQIGDFAAAEKMLRELLIEAPNNGDCLHLLGLCHHARGDSEAALQWIERALTQQPDEAVFMTNAGMVALGMGRLDQAAAYCESDVAADPLHTEAYNNLALVREQQGHLAAASALLEKTIALAPDFSRAHVNHGNVLRGLGRMDEAIAAYETAIESSPELAEAYNGLGNTLRQLDRGEDAISALEKAVALSPQYADAHFNLAMLRAAQGETGKAEAGLATAITQRNDIRFRIANAGLMPVIPSSTEEIAHWRNRMAEALSDLQKETDRPSGDPTQVPPMSFYLAYHGENDSELQEAWAAYFRSAYPELDRVAAHCLAPRTCADRPIRLGVVSRNFGEHAVAWMIQGLLSGLPRTRFEVTAVTFGASDDNVSERIQNAVDRVLAVPPHLSGAADAIAECEFDILLYADIGMEPLSYFLAFARLAPVQCVTWGHPDTTGLSSIDYYVSNDLAEPKNAQESYTENLVRLAGVQSWYPRLSPPVDLPSRASVGIPDGGAMYLCPQNLIKIHPDMDRALTAILERDPSGCLVVFEARDPNWTRLLLKRWESVFGTLMGRVVVLPQRSLEEFVGVIAIADVVLDTWPFGAGNTNYQTFSMGIPVVTLAGDWIRGRGTLAHYTHMGFDDCVAGDVEDYVEIAVRLGTDAAFRARIADLIAERSGAVLEDEVCVASFAEFLENVAP